MRVTIAPVLLLSLAACQDKSCTPEDLSQKATDLMTAARSYGLSHHDQMQKMGEKVADLVDRANRASGDLQPLCDEIAALMKEIGG
ncbi:hypothetical protein OU426_08120 [Frigidibacter sp. RF13]|uniref:hypothetical protein n=1 Tax=Frigidibacter sp. RF13 TaxID=2997340 RepID=UPI00227046C5|nr:hypothetical protein [Frigidibacter sp. RF13]MCY1126815.1 hypothetical protein [Frigidibacter sp. RF13]